MEWGKKTSPEALRKMENGWNARNDVQIAEEKTKEAEEGRARLYARGHGAI